MLYFKTNMSLPQGNIFNSLTIKNIGGKMSFSFFIAICSYRNIVVLDVNIDRVTRAHKSGDRFDGGSLHPFSQTLIYPVKVSLNQSKSNADIQGSEL